MAPISGPSREIARRFSKITGAVVEAIFRAFRLDTARRPASAPTAAAVGRSSSQRVARPSPPRSISAPSPATTWADSEKAEPRCRPEKPPLVISRQVDDDQSAEPPDELV